MKRITANNPYEYPRNQYIQNTESSITNMAVTGYKRVNQLNCFMPNDIRDKLTTNIGKNEMVNVSDFLIGDDYTKVENPYLPKGLQNEIRNHPKMTMREWTKNVMALLKTSAIRNSSHYQIEDVAYIFRYITLYPLANDNKHFVSIVISRCNGMCNEDIPRFFKNNKMVAPLTHHHYTRRNKQKKDIANDYMRAIVGCLRTIDECLYVYQGALENQT